MCVLLLCGLVSAASDGFQLVIQPDGPASPDPVQAGSVTPGPAPTLGAKPTPVGWPAASGTGKETPHSARFPVATGSPSSKRPLNAVPEGGGPSKTE